MRQLTATWSADGTHALIQRDGELLASLPVTFSRRTHSWLKPNGNRKLETFGASGIGVLNTARNGCMRGLVGCERGESACYAEDGVLQSGCFAQTTAFAMIRWNSGFDITLNGYKPGTENFFSLTLPKDGNYDLSMYRPRIFRCDSESSTSCLTLSLGTVQRWAAANPDKIFSTVCSAYFRVPAARLREASACGNIVAGVSLSSWVGLDDLQNRIAEARRYQKHGVPVVLWVATNQRWTDENPEGWRIIERELRRYDPRQIIEVPYHTRAGHTQHILNLNPWGGCCQVGVDACGRQVDMNSGLRRDDGSLAEGKTSGACFRCKNACGASWLKVMTPRGTV